MTKKFNKNNKFSRVHRNHEDGWFHVDNMGITMLCVIVIGGLAVGGVKLYHHSQAMKAESQSQNVSSRNTNEISVRIKTASGAKVFADGNEVGTTDKHGNYDFDAVKIGTKITTRYGSSKSVPVILTKANNHGTVRITYNYLRKSDAQQDLNHLYQGISNLANNNDQTTDNGTLEDFYLGGNTNTSYKDMFKWAKGQYKSFHQNDKDNTDDNNTTDVSETISNVAYTPNSSASASSSESSKSKASNASGSKSDASNKEASSSKATNNTEQHDRIIELQPKVTQNRLAQSNSQDGYDSVHFVAHVKSTSLNSDGSVKVKYTVKNDFAGKKHDHIEVFNWTATMKKKGSHWKIVNTTSALKPSSSYTD